MAESGTLPTGFGELEVLAVGTVLLVEGEPGRSWGGVELSRPPECRSQLQSWQGEVPKSYSSVLKPTGSSDGCTRGLQLAAWEPRERSQAWDREGGILRRGCLPRS